jgi:hypothetical protein
MLAQVARASDVPPEQQALILTRALAYDRNLAERAAGEVRLAVLVREGDETSVADGISVYRVFKGLEGHSLRHLPFRVVMLDVSDLAALEARIVGDDVDALYVSEGLSGLLPDLRRMARSHKATTFGSAKSYVYDGLCMGVFVHDNKPRILLNTEAAAAEGATFAAGLLRVSRVVS